MLKITLLLWKDFGKDFTLAEGLWSIPCLIEGNIHQILEWWWEIAFTYWMSIENFNQILGSFENFHHMEEYWKFSIKYFVEWWEIATYSMQYTELLMRQADAELCLRFIVPFIWIFRWTFRRKFLCKLIWTYMLMWTFIWTSISMFIWIFTWMFIWMFISMSVRAKSRLRDTMTQTWYYH